MIPNEVVVIAQEIALEFLGSAADWDNYEALAWRIFNRLRLEEQALGNSFDPPDD